MPGYSTDQQLLYLKHFTNSYYLDKIILGFYLGNDLLDNTRSVPLQGEQRKPYFELKNNQLHLRDTPVSLGTVNRNVNSRESMTTIVFGADFSQEPYSFSRLLGKSRVLARVVPSRYTHPQLVDTSVMDENLNLQKELLVAILEEMKTLVESRNQTLTIAILPGRSMITRSQSYSAQFQEYVRLFILQTAKNLRIPTIDVAQGMRDYLRIHKDARLFHPNEGHFTPAGNDFVARHILGLLEN